MSSLAICCVVVYLAWLVTSAAAMAQLLGLMGGGGGIGTGFYQQQYPIGGGYNQFQGGNYNGYPGGYYPGSGGSYGSLSQFDDPCRRVDCGPGRYCEPLSLGTYNLGPSYKCRRIENAWQNGQIYNRPTVTKCYDEVVHKIPAGSLDSSRNRNAFASMPVCTDQCQTRAQCGLGQICCTNGCGNICYTPETTVLDYANTGLNSGNLAGGIGGSWLGNGGFGGGGVYGPFSGGQTISGMGNLYGPPAMNFRSSLEPSRGARMASPPSESEGISKST